MKNLLFIFLTIITATIHSKAEVFSHSFTFNESDFSFSKSSGDSLIISSISAQAIMPEISQPGLPIIGKSIAILPNGTIENFTVSISKRLIRTNVNIANASESYPTDSHISSHTSKSICYPAKVYPDSNCVISQIYNVSGYNIASFLITPFVYDATNQKLYFVDSLVVNINIKQTSIHKAPTAIRQDNIALLKSIIDNYEDLDLPVARISQQSSNEIIEYVIITNNYLKSTFQPLADWKTKKGIRTKIITTEDINQQYTDQTLQMRIKHCINDLYNNNSLRFVLLGGDVNIVPTQPCYVKSNLYNYSDSYDVNGVKHYNTYEDASIPADVYYSCLGDLDWDENSDGLVGDLRYDKHFNLVPTLFVSRAPVNFIDEAQIFVERTINYEQNPDIKYQFFQTGTLLRTAEPGVYDDFYGLSLAEYFTNSIINGKIRIETNRLFDNFSYSGDPFNRQNVKKEFSSGYHYLQIFSHGSEEEVADNNSQVFFNVSDASSINNPKHSFVSTMACLTNAFDGEKTGRYSKPSLSEALFRNPNSGVVGYLGSSRFGIYNASQPNSGSMAYELYFYEQLFNDDYLHPATKHQGAMLTFAKSSMLSILNEPNSRWLFYAVNLLGDPETPIFSSYPKSFGTVFAAYNDGVLSVNTNVDDTNICVSSSGSDDFYVTDQGKSFTFDVPSSNLDVWITKQNYIPKKVSVIILGSAINPGDSLDIKIKLNSITPNPASSNLTIEYSASKVDSKKQILITNLYGSSNYVFDVSEFVKEATIDISHLPKGNYIVSFVEDGVISENSKQIIKL